MDLKRVKTLQLLLTAHFAIIAWLTAMLVATGSDSYFLPIFIFLVSTVAFVVVDVFELFELKSVASAIGMTLATGIAVGTHVMSVVRDSQSGQILAIAGLLVYPEAVLFLQRKNLRVFEQLAIFLLLEMIVAALVNDNIVFGLLLAPIMLLWVSSLFLFSRYTTLVKIVPNIETQQPKLAELIYRRFVRTVLGTTPKEPLVTSKFVASQEVQSSRTLRRTLQSIPLGLGALLFAGLYFYLVPRTQTESFGTTLEARSTVVGLPDQLTFGNVGRVLQNPAPVFRVSFSELVDGQPFRPDTPPYLRARVFQRYGRSGSRGSSGEWNSIDSVRLRDLSNAKYRNSLGELVTDDIERARLRDANRHFLKADFQLRPEASNQLFSVPPVFKSKAKQSIQLTYDDRYMVFPKQENTGVEKKKSVSYSIDTAGFMGSSQTRVTPALLVQPGGVDPVQNERQVVEVLNSLTAGFDGFRMADTYRRAVLNDVGLRDRESVEVALEFERHLAFSGEFKYSLDLRPPADFDIDPVEDFLLYQRSGHCQYFATAMVCLLRQSRIPSRIVIGYRPTEYNTYGKYFSVRQKDAHAWVEALFPREELKDSIFRDELTSEDRFFWVRFDPTPPPEGELAVTEQGGQAMDYAEKLWQEYVVEGQSVASNNSIYAPVSESKEAYAGLVDRLKKMAEDISSGRLFRGEIGFAWPMAILTIGLGLLGLGLWQLAAILPKLAPRLAQRLGVGRTELEMKYPFYARCMKLLAQLGVSRKRSETPLEHVEAASRLLTSHGQDVSHALEKLTAIYYRCRFAGEEKRPRANDQEPIQANTRHSTSLTKPDAATRREIQVALDELEKAVRATQGLRHA